MDMDKPRPQIYEFGDFRVDAAKRLLLNRHGETLPLMPKAFDTLLYLVEHNGKVIEKAELMSAIWADTIVEENNLTQNISILRRVLGEKHGENRFIATVPGHGYKFVADVRKMDRAGGLYPRRGDVNLGPAPIRTIAILPFKPLGPENLNEALELGMADSLIAKLSGGDEIIIRPLSAIRRYGSLEQDALAAGRELDVEAVLDGSLQFSGNRVRVLAKLLRVGDGKQLWAQQFDEKFTDIFDVQDSISESVASALKVRLSDREKKHFTENVEAYQLYMRGRCHALRLTRAETDKAIAYFQQAIELDPSYALAYVGLAHAYLPMALTSDEPSWETVPKAKAAALRAVELDDRLAEGHVVLGYTIFWYDRDWQAAENQYLRALELDPNSADARFGYAHLLSNTSQHQRAIAEIKRARELDPLSLRINAVEGNILFFAGKYDEALDRLNKTIDLEPNFWLSHLFLSRAYSEKGMHMEAVSAATRASEISGNSQSSAYRAYALAKWGKLTEARAILEELLELSATRYVPPYNIAIVYNGLGERKKALDYLEKGLAENDLRMVFLKVEPQWETFRSDPRFMTIIRRMSLE
jgi:DNA-binding winged helix-turn-helix (wHTH) protein/tetratricopeptide (TPR) repeat protein